MSPSVFNVRASITLDPEGGIAPTCVTVASARFGPPVALYGGSRPPPAFMARLYGASWRSRRHSAASDCRRPNRWRRLPVACPNGPAQARPPLGACLSRSESRALNQALLGPTRGAKPGKSAEVRVKKRPGRLPPAARSGSAFGAYRFYCIQIRRLAGYAIGNISCVKSVSFSHDV